MFKEQRCFKPVVKKVWLELVKVYKKNYILLSSAPTEKDPPQKKVIFSTQHVF